MSAFTNWLTKAFATFSITDPFYTARLCAFNKLHQPTFIASQKEAYHNLSEILPLWTAQPYHGPIAASPCLAVGGYGYPSGAVTLTFVNGIWCPSEDTHAEVQLYRLADLPLLKQKEVLSGYIADMESSDDLFVLLNRMLAQDSYLLEIDGQKVITLQHIISDAARHVVPQLIIQVGAASQVTIIENWHAPQCNLQPFVNYATHILLEAGAHLAYYTMDAPSAYQVNSLYCTQKDHTTFTHHTFAFGAAMLRMHLGVKIDGSYARASLYGLAALSATEKVAKQIQVTHTAPHSLSKQHYKSILGGQSTGHFSGKIHLTPAAQQTYGYQTNNVLILSDEARHYAKPQLEIYADDVKCSHGATTGQLDEEQLFYLQARGIAAPLAKRLLLEAFGSEIIDSVALPSLQAYLYDKLVAKLVKL